MKRDQPVDLNLTQLAYLEALIEERHVSRAAQRLNLSQPAMSLALKRLRALFDDPLLVPTPKGMTATPRAAELLESVRGILQQSRALIAPPRPFDPAVTTEMFVVGASNFVASMFLPALMARLREIAPHASVVVKATLPYRVREWFEDDELDVAVSYVVTPPGELHRRTLAPERLVCIARAEHPDVHAALTLDQLCTLPSVTVRPATRPFVGMLDRGLAAEGRALDVRLAVSDYLLVPDVVRSTTLIAVVPERLARRFAASAELQVLALPLDLPPLELSMVWHERTHHEASREWFRTTLLQTFLVQLP